MNTREPRLPWRARAMWWLVGRLERVSMVMRFATIAIWRRAIERQRRRRERKRTPPVKRWEAWYLGDARTCFNCGAANDNAAQLGECPTCGYEGKEISVG